MTVLAFAFTWLGRILAVTIIAAALFVAYCAVLQWVIERADRKRRQAEDVELVRDYARQFFPPQSDCPGCVVYDQEQDGDWDAAFIHELAEDRP